MSNFIKWIEYLATEHDYCLYSVCWEDEEYTTFNLQHLNPNLSVTSFIKTENMFNSIRLKNFNPEKLWNWRNAIQELSIINNLENYSKPVKQRAQNLLKLIEELKQNGINLMDVLEDSDTLNIFEQYILITIRRGWIEQDVNLKNWFKFEDGHFKELNQTTDFKQLLKLLILVKHKEGENGKKARVH